MPLTDAVNRAGFSGAAPKKAKAAEPEPEPEPEPESDAEPEPEPEPETPETPEEKAARLKQEAADKLKAEKEAAEAKARKEKADKLLADPHKLWVDGKKLDVKVIRENMDRGFGRVAPPVRGGTRVVLGLY